ncbi:hypothetical protein BHE74_00013784 [Ensete ventricosum]|nr:hypothetical protein BHE74_00013784 [Ensete ventricosum]
MLPLLRPRLAISIAPTTATIAHICLPTASPIHISFPRHCSYCHYTSTGDNTAIVSSLIPKQLPSATVTASQLLAATIFHPTPPPPALPSSCLLPMPLSLPSPSLCLWRRLYSNNRLSFPYSFSSLLPSVPLLPTLIANATPDPTVAPISLLPSSLSCSRPLSHPCCIANSSPMPLPCSRIFSHINLSHRSTAHPAVAARSDTYCLTLPSPILYRTAPVTSLPPLLIGICRCSLLYHSIPAHNNIATIASHCNFCRRATMPPSLLLATPSSAQPMPSVAVSTLLLPTTMPPPTPSSTVIALSLAAASLASRYLFFLC